MAKKKEKHQKVSNAVLTGFKEKPDDNPFVDITDCQNNKYKTYSMADFDAIAQRVRDTKLH